MKTQLKEALFRQDDFENEAIRLRSILEKKNLENLKLKHKVRQLEAELYRKPEPPPPPPPQPPKSLFSNLKNPFLKKTKHFRSVPENMNISGGKQGKLSILRIPELTVRLFQAG